MYQTHFHLNDRPFASAPNPEHYFPAASIEQAREAIASNVERAAGVTLLMGPVGAGKTLLCQLIANHFTGELPVCLLPGERVRNCTVLLQAALHKLGLPFQGQNEGELRLTLTNHVTGAACPKGILMIVDEADRLPLELLEEIRVITNLVQDGQPRVRLVLAGAARLEERVGHPKLESLNQRVVGRLHLENFSEEETSEYVKARITSCGGDAPSVFTDDALQTLYRATAGVPRLVNQVCDHALLMSAVGDADQLDGRVMEEAWSDLQQLPIPSGSFRDKPDPSAQPDIVVEFGSLDDDDAMVHAYAHLEELQQVVATLNEESEIAAIDISGDVQLENTVEISGDFEVETEVVIGGNFEIEGEAEASSVEITFDPQETIASDHIDTVVEVDTGDATDPVGEVDAGDATDPVGEVDAGDISDPVGEADAVIDGPIASDSELDHALSTQNANTIAACIEDPPQDVNTISSLIEDEQYSDIAPPALSVFIEDEPEGIELFHEYAGDSTAEERVIHEMIGHDKTESAADDVAHDATMEIHEYAGDSTVEEPVIHEMIGNDKTESAADDVAHDATIEMTIAQAANPFDEEFSEEEIVIQEFGSPSRLARQGQEYVTSGYSRHLANQLAVAYPGLRMHSEEEEVPEVEVELEEPLNEFRPLSAYIEDELDYDDDRDVEVTIQLEADRFDPSSDPVLPESVLTTSAENSVAIGGEVMVEETISETVEQTETPPEVEIAVETVAEEVAPSRLPEATIFMEAETEPRPPRAKKKRVFRRLFSSMRRS